MNHSDPKSFGYYSVGQFEVFSKIEALELSARVNQPVQYHFNDSEYSAADWGTEPSASLQTLYMQRAVKIREQYDHVVLFYSGGADSHNMLEAFLHAGVEPDEIASFHSMEGDKGNKNSVFNKEIFVTAVPYVQALKDSGRLSAQVEHRLIDMTYVVDYFNRTVKWSEYMYYTNSSVSINNTARAVLRKCVTEWANLIAAGKRVALVWGHDKPRVNQWHDQFFLEFMDIQDNCVSVLLQQQPVDGYFDELFYNTGTMPEIMVKQAHTVKNFLSTVHPGHPYMTRTISGLGHVMLQVNGVKTPHWLTQNGLSYLIYPWFNDTLYYEGKPKDIITSKRDTWFWSDPVLSQQFHASVASAFNQLGSTWANLDNGNRWTNNFRSKKYLVG